VRVHGAAYESTPSVVILDEVDPESPCLHQEIPCAVLCLIPFEHAEKAVEIARHALRRNGREAWTALTGFGSSEDARNYARSIPAYRVLHGGVNAGRKT
jgi:acyl-CoA reductase-like NAD-dependent aldehyde dehydrogenase